MMAIDVRVENICNLDALFWHPGEGQMNTVNIIRCQCFGKRR